jgi:multiple sugar transport system permease protein
LNSRRLVDNPWLFLVPVIVVIAVLTIPATLMLIYESLVTWRLNVAWTHLPFVGADNYIAVLSSQLTYVALLNSATFVLGSLLIEFTLGIGIALLFDRMIKRRLPGTGFFRTVFVLPMVVPPVVVGLIWRFMFYPTSGVVNYVIYSLGFPIQPFLGSTIQAMPSLIAAEVWEWTPLVVLTVITGLSLLPQEPFEAAELDGASAWQKFRDITFPLIRPLILALLIIRTTDLLKWVDTIFVMTEGGPGAATETLAYHIYNVAFRAFRLDQGAVLTIMALIAAIILANVFSRTMMRK